MQCHIATSLRMSFLANNIQNVVVATQPTAMPAVTVVDPRLKPKPTVMIVTIVLTVVCLVQGCWPALVCMAPALIAAVVVSPFIDLCIGYSYNIADWVQSRNFARGWLFTPNYMPPRGRLVDC